VLVRLHNVEFEYYHQLAKSTQSFFKKIYFFTESKLLKKYEAVIAHKAKLLAVNEKDKCIYQNEFRAKDVIFLPVFLPFSEVKSKTGKGTFCLYQGNLSVPENEKAVVWLLENVFNNSEMDFVVAGKNPSAFLKKLLKQNEKVRLIENPSEEKMEALIINAHIHLLPSFNATGIKIKLLNALFNGRFIITNQASLEGTGLETLCEVANTPQDYKEIIQRISAASFLEEEVIKRNTILQSKYNTDKNVQQLIEWLYGNKVDEK
jgi:glycosyltransferase involved in cell wall biosynthesis